MSDHKCHARGCERGCKPEHLMCLMHWRMVPRGVQVKVYRHYQEGQCELSPRPTKKWHAAADAAIASVAHKEGRIDDETYERIMRRSAETLKGPGGEG